MLDLQLTLDCNGNIIAVQTGLSQPEIIMDCESWVPYHQEFYQYPQGASETIIYGPNPLRRLQYNWDSPNWPVADDLYYWQSPDQYIGTNFVVQPGQSNGFDGVTEGSFSAMNAILPEMIIVMAVMIAILIVKKIVYQITQ